MFSNLKDRRKRDLNVVGYSVLTFYLINSRTQIKFRINKNDQYVKSNMSRNIDKKWPF